MLKQVPMPLSPDHDWVNRGFRFLFPTQRRVVVYLGKTTILSSTTSTVSVLEKAANGKKEI